MKELSIEEKAKRYDEILARAKGANIPYYKEDIMSKVKEFVDYLLPELKESGEEKIKEKIIATIHLYYGEPLEEEAKEMIAWLEKQGEQKPWSEEDKRKMRAIITIINSTSQSIICSIDQDRESLGNWLKSLRPQKQDVMSEDEFRHIVGYLVQDIVANEHMAETEKQPTKFFVEKYYNKLRPPSTWKPSDEQIRTCKEVYADILSAKGFDLGTVNSELNRLEEELKKLKE